MTLDANSIDPAALYGQYRRHRLVDASFDALFRAPVENAAASSPIESPSHEESVHMDQASELFQHWRRARSADDHAGAIDSLMQDIAMQQARETLLDKHFRVAADSDTAVLPAASAGESAGEVGAESAILRVFTLPGRALAQAQQWLKRPAAAVLVPAMAFGLLAVVVVPRILPVSDSVPTQLAESAGATALPASLLANAAATGEWLDDSPGGSAAFTAGVSLRSSRFALGSVSTRLALVAAGATAGNPGAWQASIRGPAGLETDPHIQRARDALADANDSGDPVALGEGLRSVETALSAAAVQPDGYPWYRFGQLIEAVYLSAGLALADDDFGPLQDSLEAFRSLQDLPADSAGDPVYRKVQALRQVSASSALSPRDARELQSLSLSIRTLMRQ